MGGQGGLGVCACIKSSLIALQGEIVNQICAATIAFFAKICALIPETGLIGQP
jgi:hypothetical protein